MTFGIYIKTIKKKGKIRGDQRDMVNELFESAGANDSVPPERADSWLRDRASPTKDDFSNNALEDAAVISFFKEKIPSTWTDVRDEFMVIEKHSAINFDTEIPDVFFDRLLDQFYSLLGMQRLRVSLRSTVLENQVIFGRETELRDIDRILEQSNYAAITGMSGVGKSHLAQVYAYKKMHDGDYTVQYIKCEEKDTIFDAVQKIEFDGVEIAESEDEQNAKFDLRINALKKCQQESLIVFDNLNYNIIPKDRAALEKLIRCGQHIKLLFTSRERNVLGDNRFHLINLSLLNADDLLQLYAYHRFSDGEDHSTFMEEREELLTDMFEKVGYHTLAIVFLAKLPRLSSLNEYEISNKLNEGLGINSGIVKIKSGDQNLNINMRGLIKAIIDISLFSDIQRCIMRHMTLIPFRGIKLRTFRDLSGLKESEIIKLVHGNWIVMEQEEQRISLHPLVAEALCDMAETKPSVEDCGDFLDRLWSKDAKTTAAQTWYDLGYVRYHVLKKLNIGLPSMSIEGMRKLLVESYSEFLDMYDDDEGDIFECGPSYNETNYFYTSEVFYEKQKEQMICIKFGIEALEAVKKDGIDALNKYIDEYNAANSFESMVDEWLDECSELNADGIRVLDIDKLFGIMLAKDDDDMENPFNFESRRDSGDLMDSENFAEVNSILLEESGRGSDFLSIFESTKFMDIQKKQIIRLFLSIKEQRDAQHEDYDAEERMQGIRALALEIAKDKGER